MIAYLDTPSGISGDMFLGCLVSAGWSVERLRFVAAQLRLPAEEWSVAAKKVKKGAIEATLVEVTAAEGHHHRHLADVRGIIEGSDLPATVKERAVKVFVRLAEAEAKVHGTTVEKIHFHEVGAVDAIIDIVGVVAGLQELEVELLYASALPLGNGWAKTEHGQIPLPAPATLELLAAVKAPTRPAPGPGEFVTPTGAALVAELATFGQPAMQLQRIGMGAGTKDFAWPNVARLWLGQPEAGGGGMVQLETNIDDMNPQLYGAVTERLFAAGAKDVWLTPVQMKKGRPGVVLSVLGPASKEMDLTGVIFRETTTLGVRAHQLAARHEARREMRTVETRFGAVGVKVKFVEDEAVGAMPEYDECKKLAEAAGISVREVWEAAAAAATNWVEGINDVEYRFLEPWEDRLIPR